VTSWRGGGGGEGGVVRGARTYYYRKYRGPSWDVVPYELAGTYIHKSADTAVRGMPCGPVSLEAPRLT